MKQRGILLSLMVCVLLVCLTLPALAAEPVYEPDYRTIALDTGITMRYALLGDAENPTVVLLHGATDSYLSFSQVAPVIAAAGYAVLVPELRGHGGTDKPEEGPYTLEQHVADVFSLLQKLEIEQPYIGGHSLGSFVAQALVAEHGAELGVRGTILIGTGAGVVDNPILTWMLYGDQEFPGLGAFAEGVPLEFIEEWVATNNPDPIFAMMTKEHALALPPHSWINTFFGLEGTDTTELLHKITCPVLILWGSEDMFFSAEDQQRVRDALQQSVKAEFMAVEGASHNTHWDEGAIKPVTEAILDFLAKNP